jgi:xylulokinase
VTVGIDIGTTSVKAVAVDAGGRIVERVRLPHALHTAGPGRFEHDVGRAWQRGPKRALQQLAHLRPAAAAVSTMVPSMAPLTARGRPLGPGLLYGDERGRPPGAAVGAPAESDEALSFLRWLVAHHPDAARCWPASAVANHALSGRGVADIGTCFTMGSLLGAGGWSEEACASAGTTPAVLPAMGGSGDEIGAVTGTDIVLAAGSVDGYCEQLVAGADQPGDVLVLCGTTLIVWVVTAEPVLAPGLWNVPHSVPGLHLVGGASNGGGLFTGWLDALLRPQPPQPPQPARGSRQEDPERDAGSLGLRDAGDVPVWVPYIRGERTPYLDPSLRASLHGVHLGHGPEHLRRAGFEATGFVVRHHLELSGVAATRIVAVGGGTRVPGWMPALADATGLPVHVAADPEGAARGAAYLARMAVGGGPPKDAGAWASTGTVVDPDPRWTGPAAERYQAFRAATRGGGER